MILSSTQDKHEISSFAGQEGKPEELGMSTVIAKSLSGPAPATDSLKIK